VVKTPSRMLSKMTPAILCVLASMGSIAPACSLPSPERTAPWLLLVRAGDADRIPLA